MPPALPPLQGMAESAPAEQAPRAASGTLPPVKRRLLLCAEDTAAAAAACDWALQHVYREGDVIHLA